MRYFFIADDGKSYGPADVPTLVQWVAEGRIGGHHWLDEEGTGRRIQAFQLPELGFGQVGYPRPPTNQASTPTLALAWVLGALSFIPCCFFIGIGGIYVAYRIEMSGTKATGPKVLSAFGLLSQMFWLSGGGFRWWMHF